MTFKDKEIVNNSTSIRVSEECRKLAKVMSNYVFKKYNLRLKPSYSECMEKLIIEYLKIEEVEYNLNDIK